MPNVLITGTSRGIGLELARAYAGRGDRVFAACRHPATADDLKELARREDSLVRVVGLDVADAESVAAAAAGLDHEPLDILVNNAGVMTPDRQSAFDMDFEGWANAFAINTMGPLRVTQALLPNLRAGRDPRVAIISSRMGSFSNGGVGGDIAYRSTKAAVNRVAQILGGDYRREGIAVAAIHPGWVRTRMGGTGAPLSARDSAAAIVRLIDRLDPSTSGSFLDVDGQSISW